jgi:hypothetical protein
VVLDPAGGLVTEFCLGAVWFWWGLFEGVLEEVVVD